jgi:hypothetical protein
MLYAFFVAAALLLAAVLYSGLKQFGFRKSSRFKAARIVTCPETRESVTVETAGLRSPHIENCTRWPEKHNCGQECLREIQDAPDGCLVRTTVRRWYEGKSCVQCGKSLSDAGWVNQPPCVMTPDGVTYEWKYLEPAQIADVLETAKPVCWTCHVASEFRRQHPELVLERENHPQPVPHGGSHS